MTTPKGMDAEYFLKTFGDDAAFNEPWIYILRQDPQIPDPPYYRCGAAGTQLFPDADRPYQASETSRKGLAGRVTQYIGHIRPNKVLLFAALGFGFAENPDGPAGPIDPALPQLRCSEFYRRLDYREGWMVYLRSHQVVHAVLC